jgi:hypothetical protein
VQIAAIVPEVETDVTRPQLALSVHPGVEVSFFLVAKPVEWVHRISTEESVLPIFLLSTSPLRLSNRAAAFSIPKDFLLSA